MARTLRYFDCRGRAQPLRDFFCDADIQVHDEHVGLERWGEMRATAQAGPFRSLPVLEWDGEQIAETLPIAAFLDRRLGLLEGLSAREVGELEMVRSASYIDLMLRVGELIWCDVICPGADLVKSARRQIPRAMDKLRRFDEIAAQAGEYLGGERPAIADFFVLEGAEAMVHVMGDGGHAFVSSLPALHRLCERLRSRPAIAALFRGQARPARFTSRPDEMAVIERLHSINWD